MLKHTYILLPSKTGNIITKSLSVFIAIFLISSIAIPIFGYEKPVLAQTSDFISLSTACINGLQVDINGGASPGSAITSISWNWGDGQTTVGLFPKSHTYATGGPYTITVTSHYNDGSSASATQTVNVASGDLANCDQLTITAGLGGSVSYSASVGSGTVQAGSSTQLYLDYADDLNLAANPANGYSFSSWATSGTITGYGSQPIQQTPAIPIVVGSNGQITANFVSAITTFPITFTESGLPTGTSWSVTLNGNTQSSSSSNITFNEPNGNYPFIVNPPSSYNVVPYSGSVTVNGGPTSQALAFVPPVQEAGSTPVSMSFTGTVTGPITNMQLTLASGTITAGGQTYALTGSSGQYCNQNNIVCNAPNGVLSAGFIQLPNNLVLGFASCYKQTSSNQLSLSFYNGKPNTCGGTTAIVQPPSNAFYCPFNATGTLTISGTQATISAQGTGNCNIPSPTPDITTTEVTLFPSVTSSGGETQVTATVIDTKSSTTPTGTISWNDVGAGGSFSSNSCTLMSTGPNESQCQVQYTSPEKAGTAAIEAYYTPSNTNFAASSGSTSLTLVTASSITGVQNIVTFTGLDVISSSIPLNPSDPSSPNSLIGCPTNTDLINHLSITAGGLKCFTIQQNFWVDEPSYSEQNPEYWVQNALIFGTDNTGSWYVQPEINVYQGSNTSPSGQIQKPEYGSVTQVFKGGDPNTSNPVQFELKSVISNGQITMNTYNDGTPLGSLQWIPSSPYDLSLGSYVYLNNGMCSSPSDCYFVPELDLVGPPGGGNVEFGTGTSGNIQALMQLNGNEWLHTLSLYPSFADATYEKSVGPNTLTVYPIGGTNIATFIANGGPNEGVAFFPLSSSLPSASTSTIITDGSASVNQSTQTGVTVNVSDSTSNGAVATVVTSDLNSIPVDAAANLSIGELGFYDVNIGGISDGTAQICISNSNIIQTDLMQYWYNDVWNTVINPTVSGNTICGNIPVSALTGTQIVVGSSAYPTTVASVTSGTLGNNGWYRSSVGVTLTSTEDNGPGVKSITYSLDGNIPTANPTSSVVVNVSGNGSHSLTYFSTDKNGISEPVQTFNLKIDSILPTITANVSPTPNPNGWNNSPVTVTFTCSDALSGVATCPQPATLSTTGYHQPVTVTGTDNAGNTATTTVFVSINLGMNCPSVNEIGVNLKGDNLEGCYLQGANLSNDNLQGANLIYTDLADATLKGVNLHDASLQSANLQRANLAGANLSGANLQNTNLQNTNLQNTNLRGADLTGADLSGAIITGANFNKAITTDCTGCQ